VMEEDDNLIAMKGVWKKYGKLEVLREFNLMASKGQKLVILGPSGSGKSTVLRILMTLEGIDSGEVKIDGESLWTMNQNGIEAAADDAHLHRIRAKVGMVFQGFNLFPHMNALRNITEAMIHVLGVPKSEARERAMALLDEVGLAGRAEAYPWQLSGGQRQRVAIARALALRPKIMLFDEITSALDPELVGEVLNVLRKLARETDITMLIVTHHMSFAKEIADRVVFMDHGEILEDGRPEDVMKNPAHERTRKFLGTVLENV